MFDVFIDKKNNQIHTGIVIDDSEAFMDELEYAFYLYKDDTRIEVLWYTKNSNTIFEIDDTDGVYYVKGFVRSKQNRNPVTRESKRIMYNKIPYDIYKWKKPIYNMSLEDIKIITELKNGIYHTDCNNQSIDFIVDGIDFFDEQKGILVCFSGAVTNRECKYAPFFSGLNIAKKLEMPIISIADPSLSISNDCNLAWYAGNKNANNVPETIAYILDSISERLNTKLIVFGGSGGGFATLSITKLMRCKHSSLVWNPQTSITEYNKRFVSIYLKECFSDFHEKFDMYSFLDKNNIIHDLTKVYGEKNTLEQNDILYLQNSDDRFHIENHLKPFMDGLDVEECSKGVYKSNNGIVFWIDDWGVGHSPPSMDVLMKVLDGIIYMRSNLDIVSELLVTNDQ